MSDKGIREWKIKQGERMNKLSNHELNRRVAKLLYPLATIYKSKELKCGVCIHHSSDCDPSLPWILNVDYCNNWNDLMPLISECDIQSFITGVGVQTEINDFSHRAHKATSPTLQRALVECFLKVLESNK